MVGGQLGYPEKVVVSKHGQTAARTARNLFELLLSLDDPHDVGHGPARRRSDAVPLSNGLVSQDVYHCDADLALRLVTRAARPAWRASGWWRALCG